ncbi:MAG: class II aldolase/adducin family protein, partial [Bacilli bacterium]|nr:class II aldolase/adducin family protein [Bacilli bacterium]
AEKMKEFRTVVWLLHGVYGAGKTLDETFGLIETVEKAAQIYNLIGSRPIKNTLSEDNFKELIDLFGISPRYDFFVEEKYRKLAKK